MNASILPVLMVSAVALFAAGCGSPMIKESKETVIEKPVVSKETREIVVEQPVTREVIVERQIPAPRSCTYGATGYSDGSVSCQGGYRYRCTDGVWTTQNLLC